jgi:alpha-galactosidase
MDYMTPGSPDHGDYALPANSSGAAIAFHKAIQNAGVNMRLDISWKLDRSDPYWGIWRSTSDSLRVDQDINNSGQDTFTAWQTVLRTIEFYRQFINEQTVSGRHGQGIMIRPDMDNTYIGNAASVSGLSDVQ